MKNFAIPLIITGTNYQLEAITSKLEKLGYRKTDFLLSTFPYNILVTSYSGTPSYMTNDGAGTLNSYQIGNPSRIVVSADNEELLLALAAMVEGDKFYEGEIIVALKSSGHISRPDAYQMGIFYRVTKVSEFMIDTEKIGKEMITNGWSKNNFRKATREEILVHFNTNKVCGKVEEEKTLVGYKVRDDLDRKAVLSLISANEHSVVTTLMGYDFAVTSVLHERAIDKNILNLFTPVYREQYRPGDWVLYKGVPGDGFGKNCCNKILQLIDKSREDELGRNKKKTSFSEDFFYDNISGLCNSDKKADFLVEDPSTSNYFFRISSEGIERKATIEEIKVAQRRVLKLQCKNGTTFELEVSKKGIYYKPENTWLDPKGIQRILNSVRNSNECTLNNVHGYKSTNPSGSYFENRGYNFKLVVERIDMGCMKGVLIKELETVMATYNDLLRS